MGGGRGRTVGEKVEFKQSTMMPIYEEDKLGMMIHIYNPSTRDEGRMIRNSKPALGLRDPVTESKQKLKTRR